MFFIISKIFQFFASPSHLMLFIAVLGVALLFTRWRRWGRRLATLGVVLLLAIAFGPIGHILAVPLETRFPAPSGDMTAPDGIVVLGGSVDENLGGLRGRVAFESSAERLTAPIELLRRYPKARLVFTGGSAALRGSPFTEAQVVRQFWQDVGLDQGAVVYEDRSRNTFENAVFTRELIQPKEGERWLLVTSAMHMPRSVGIFRQAGFRIVPYPVDYRTTGELWKWRPAQHAPRALELMDFAAHEWLGLAIYRATGKTNALFPAP